MNQAPAPSPAAVPPIVPTPTTSTIPPTPPAVGSQAASVGNWLKEVVAAALSAVIVGFTMYFMWKMFEAPDDIGENIWQHQSAILQVAVGFAGTITGYYFGRIPAERAAATAQQAANSAQQSLVNTSAAAQQAAANEKRIRTQVSDLRSQMSTSTPLGGGAASLDAAAFRTQVAERLDQILRG